MSYQIRVPRNETEVPLNLFLNNSGPVTGATAVVAIRDGDTPDSYLDFNDNTFKTAGHTTRQAALTEGEVGVYTLVPGLDLSAITNLPAGTDHLIAEFEVTAPAASTGIVSDMILIDDRLEDANDISIADVQTALDNQGYTAARAVALDNLDAAISSVITAIAALNDLSIADVQTALDNQGYTSARAANLDNIDSAFSTRVTLIEAILRNKMITDPVTGILTIRNDTDTADLLTAQLYEDAGETQTYQGLGAEVRLRLT